MSLFTKDQLLTKSLEELQQIAEPLGIYSKGNREVLIYEILDAQAEMHSSEQAEDIQGGRRTRIVKKDVNRIYSASRERSERYDKEKKAEVPSAAMMPDAAAQMPQSPSLFPSLEKDEKTMKQAPTEQKLEAEPVVVLPKRKRGRPSKAEIAAREAAERQLEEMRRSEDAAAAAEEKATPAESRRDDDEMPDFVMEQIQRREQEPVSQETPAAAPFAASPSSFIIIQDIPYLPTEDFFMNDRYERQEMESAPRNMSAPKGAAGPLRPAEGPAAQQTPDATSWPEENNRLEGRGVLEVVGDGYGFLRSSDYNYLTSPDDIYVSPNQIYQYGLKNGDVVEGWVKIPREGDKFFSLLTVDRINGREPHEVRDRISFEHLTPLFPDQKFQLCTGKNDSLSCRIVDLIAPIGKGQRALIVAQPKTGKTMLMKDIANAIARNHPDTYLMMLLIDERPEEVTDMARTVDAEVIASTFDEPAARHVKIANIVLDKAKRMVECGHDVVIFLDSITRLARAYNTVAPTSGKILTGGVDANALQKPKRFFGAARNIEGGGSLTIIATALIDTGSKMDEVIFEEFKGTGNMELQLDRSLANKRVFPAINLVASSTRRDDLLLPQQTLNRMYVLRNFIADMTPIEAMTDVKKRLEDTLNNDEFILAMNS
jgi:transcription termination factor Rho